MFAVLKTGGKQYKVSPGDVLRVEKLAAEPGDKVRFTEVLMLGGDETVVGTPFVDGAGVIAEVIDQIKGEKVIHFVRRRRKHSSKRTKGHRQHLTLVRILEVLAEGADKADAKPALGAREARRLAAQGAVTAKKPAAKSAKKKPAARKADKPATEAAEMPGRKPSNLLDAPRGGKADDLKKISGVGPKLEQLLNENGIYHFDQIAAWTPEEVAYMDEKLSFRGRIEREGWIEQARKLAAEAGSES